MKTELGLPVYTYLNTCSKLLLAVCVGQCLMFNGNSALASEGLVMQRIQSNETLKFYYNELGESGRRLIGKLDERSSELDAIPSRSETIRILGKSDAELSQLEWLSFETIIRQMQQPQVTRQVLFDMYLAFSQAVPPLNCSYRVTAKTNRQAGDGEQGSGKVVECQFSRSTDNSTFFSKSGDLFSDNVARVTWIFNGVEMREIEEAREGLSNEFVFIPPSLRSLYPEYHPFTAARIAPEEAAQDPRVRQHAGFAVFEDAATVVFESREENDGREFVAVGFMDWAILLDPSLDYAIVEERFGELDFRGKYESTALHQRKQNSDFVKLGDGPFLPRRSLVEQWRKGRLYKRVETVIDSISVQPEHSFEEKFERPRRLHVANDVTGESHLSQEVRPSGTMDIETPSQSSSHLFWWLVGGNATLAAVVLCVWYRRKR